MDKQVVISIKTVIFTFLLLLGAYIVYRLGNILSILLIALILVISLEPLVKFFMSKTVMNKLLSRSVAVILAYSLLIFALVVIFTIGLPPVVAQAQKLIASLGQLLESISTQYGIQVSFANLAPQFSQISGGVLTFTYAIFSNITTLLSLLVLSLYMSLDWENIKERFLDLFPDNLVSTVADIITHIELSVGHWVKGELTLMFVVGAASFIGLVLLRVNYPLALGIIAGLLEIVPILGPIIVAVLAAIIAFADSPLKGVAVLGLFFIIQQLENNLLVPKIMQKVSGFSPLVILIALLVGSNFFGVIGAILSVPITMISAIIIKKALSYSSPGSE